MRHDRPLSIAVEETPTRYRRESLTWDQVVKGLSLPGVGQDKTARGLRLFGELAGARKTAENVVARSLFPLDADHVGADDDLPARVQRLGCAAVLYPTFRHRPEAPRYRVIVLPDRDLTPDEYLPAVAALEARLGGGFDPAMRSIAQAIYAPVTTDPDEYAARLLVVDGPPVAVDDLLVEADALGLQIESQGLSDPAPYDGPDYDSLPSDQQARAREHVAWVLADWRARFAGVADWSEGDRDEKRRGWEVLARDAAIALARTVAHPAYPFSEEDAERAYRELVEPFGGAVPDKWARAVTKARREPCEPVRWSTPAEDFGPLDDDEESESGAVAGDPTPLDKMVERELRRMRARHRAAELFRAEQRPELPPFDAGTLAQHLLKPEPPAARVDGLIPWDASTVVIAQRKAGKTTLTLNLAHSLLTGEPFLGSMGVRPVEGTVALLNYEVSGYTVARWAQEAGIPADRLFVVNLRGASNPFADPERLDQLGRLLRSHGVESLVVDPFGRAFPGESQNDAGQVQSWLVSLDTFAREQVGARDVVLTVHAGWNGDRARGSSALEDWGDALIYLTKDDETEQRFIRAIGRDVELAEDQVRFDPTTRALTLAGVGPRQVARQRQRQNDLMDHVLATVAANPGANGSKIGELLREAGVPHNRDAHRPLLAEAVASGLLRVRSGPRNQKFYTLATEPDSPDERPANGAGAATNQEETP